MLPPELLTPGNLVLTSFLGIGLAIGAAFVYVKKNLMTPTQAKSTDVVLSGCSLIDMTEVKEMRKDLTRIAVALEELARLRREQSREEEMEEKMQQLLDRLSKAKRQ